MSEAEGGHMSKLDQMVSPTGWYAVVAKTIGRKNEARPYFRPVLAWANQGTEVLALIVWCQETMAGKRDVRLSYTLLWVGIGPINNWWGIMCFVPDEQRKDPAFLGALRRAIRAQMRSYAKEA